MIAKKDRRSRATKASLKSGGKNEDYIKSILKPWAMKHNFICKHWKEEGRQYQEGYDFTIYRSDGKIKFHIECERKSGEDYERFFHPDWDFLPQNNGMVQLVFKKPNVVVKEPVYYFMTITENNKTMVAKYILYANMKDIKEYDSKVRRPTKRDGYKKKESFYHYPYNRFKIINPVTKEI